MRVLLFGKPRDHRISDQPRGSGDKYPPHEQWRSYPIKFGLYCKLVYDCIVTRRKTEKRRLVMEQRPTPEQSLQLINDMMAQARRSHQKVNFYFLLWGVLFALAGIAAHVLFRSGWEFHWIVWPIAGVLGGIISGVRGSREGKQQHSSTFMDRVHQWLWISYVITLVLMIIALVKLRIDPNPFVLLLTALPTFVSGAL